MPKTLFTKIDSQPASHSVPNRVLSYKFLECRSYFLALYIYLVELLVFVFHTAYDQ